MPSCKYCGNNYTNVKSHITKSHTTFYTYLNRRGELLVLKRKIENDPMETATQDRCAPEHFWFPDDVKKNQKTYAINGVFYACNDDTQELMQYKGDTSGVGKKSTFNGVIKNQIKGFLIKRKQ